MGQSRPSVYLSARSFNLIIVPIWNLWKWFLEFGDPAILTLSQSTPPQLVINATEFMVLLFKDLTLTFNFLSFCLPINRCNGARHLFSSWDELENHEKIKTEQ